MLEDELGVLNTQEVNRLHNLLMTESALYKTAAELRLTQLQTHLMLRQLEMESQSANKPN